MIFLKTPIFTIIPYLCNYGLIRTKFLKYEISSWVNFCMVIYYNLRIIILFKSNDDGLSNPLDTTDDNQQCTLKELFPKHIQHITESINILIQYDLNQDIVLTSVISRKYLITQSEWKGVQGKASLRSTYVDRDDHAVPWKPG